MNTINMASLFNNLPYFFLIFFIIIKSIGVFLSVIAILIIGEFKSKVKNHNKIDYAIILGAGLDGAQVSTRIKNRLEQGYSVLKDLDVPIIVSGGQGPDELVTEAYAMSQYLINKGIANNRLVLEEKSTSTQENLLFSARYIPENRNNILIVTSDYHMFRAKMLGKRMNWNIQGASAKSAREDLPKEFIREIFAVLKDLIVRKY